MGVRVREDQVLLPIGGIWSLHVLVTDLDGCPVDEVPTVTVTLPDGSTATPEVETICPGDYRAGYTTTAAGRHVAHVATVDYGAADVAAYAAGPTTEAGMPVVDDVADYLGDVAAQYTTQTLQGALDAEAAAQRGVCRIRAAYPADLREALLRRVHRNLEMRQLPLAVLRGDADAGSTTLPGSDPEVRRLERPHRKLTVG